jgi:serine/threonine protein kinase
VRRPSVRPVSTSAASLPSLARGVVVGHYRLEKEIARGGMGEVYRATDVRLKRTVALKVLRGEAAQETRRVERFAREAEAASALNHPGIVAVYEAGRSTVHGEPIFYLAMEAVDGPSLATVLAAERLPLKRALELAAGIAEALAAAHEAGILHRDLKPSNIIVSAGGDGVPRIVDFGLAKQASDADSAGPSRERETLTAAGEILGTAGYMSPEQARGDPVTGASDQFAFGCVLYELLTGIRAFDAGSFVETLSSVLRDEPAPFEQVAPTVPLPLRWIVARCLAKAPSQRYASTADLARDLKMLAESYASLTMGTHVPAHRHVTRRGVESGAAVAVAMVGGALAWYSPPPATKGLEFRPLTFRSGFVARALFTPRSNGILFAAAWEGAVMRMYQTMVESVAFDRSLDSPVQLPLAYSDDGAQVLVLLGVGRESSIMRGTLAWWPALGGTPRPIIEGAGWSDWAARSRRLAVVRDAREARILELRDENGRLVRALFSTQGAITWVRFSPDEQRLAFIRLTDPYANRGEVWSVSVDGGDARPLTGPMLSCRGLAWHRGTGELWFTGAFDNAWTTTLYRLRSGSEIDNVQSLPGLFCLQDIDAERSRWMLTSYREESDVIIHAVGRPPERRRWFGWSVANDISPDSQSFLFYDGGAGERTWGMWIRPVAGGDAFRVCDGTEGHFSPDGRSVVATRSVAGGPAHILVQPVGAGEGRVITSGKASYSWPTFEDPDTVLAVRHEGPAAEVVRVHLTDGQVTPLGVRDCDSPSMHPTRKALACVADTGHELRVHPLHPADAAGAARVVLRLSGGKIMGLRWNRDGRQIYVQTSDRRFVTVDPVRGEVGNDELPDPAAGPYDHLIGAAVDDLGRTRIYSVVRMASIVYLATPRGE